MPKMPARRKVLLRTMGVYSPDSMVQNGAVSAAGEVGEKALYCPIAVPFRKNSVSSAKRSLVIRSGHGLGNRSGWWVGWLIPAGGMECARRGAKGVFGRRDNCISYRQRRNADKIARSLLPRK